ncbi:Ca-activated chloride channel family protein [Cohaesibacter sp. ES.047]|uniref:marine proteobacterial sortase target protein n=1 Tax=Cohaesibacter sp. ES.047 TaxID=1798205 RepID=UPI000BB78C4A|nr:marine proteobacterial sortase target protein [Cohaesibacter sp. ES.047]SNY91531.1 Ca-activated chloride channel family protein [Cohaesibacter sp. ES.047]
MRQTKSKRKAGERERHFVELGPKKSNHEQSISSAFKIWIGAYAAAVLLGLLIVPHVAHSAPIPNAEQIRAQAGQAPSAPLIRPDDMQSGGLLFKSKEEGRYIEAPKVATDIKLDITGPVARAVVTQKFANPSDAWLEGVYVFPLPDNAAVDRMKMKIGERLIEGIIKPKEEARQIYETAKREGKKASLLEQHRPNLFTNAVANIGPGESITIQIEYQQTIPRKNDEFSLRVPLVVAPRYNPTNLPLKPVMDLEANQSESMTGWGNTDPVPDRKAITAPVLDPEKHPKTNPVTLSVDLKPGFPIENVVSHYHDVTITPGEDNRVTLTLGKDAVPADKDFQLTWTGKPGKTPNLGLFHQTLTPDTSKTQSETANDEPGNTVTGEDYLLAYITPPYKLSQELAVPPREVVFVIDQSGSMAGPSIRQAKASLIEALGQLKPQDKFQIIRFNNKMAELFATPREATPEAIDLARSWVKAINADGGTEMLPAMMSALKDGNPDSGTLRQVIFLTDGAIGNERQLFEAVKSQKGRSRIFTVGIGSAPNSFFMSRAAEVGRGTFTHIGDVTEVKDKMGKLFTQLTSPVATDLKIELEGGEGVEASPSALPDLYRGEPVIMAIKAAKLGKTLKLTGRFNNQPWSMSVDITKAAPSKAIDTLWARGKIRQLENERLLSNDYASIDKSIEALGLKHHLVTRLTSLVAVDVTPSRPAEEELESKKVPLNLPDGWEFDKVFGEQAEVTADTAAPMQDPSVAPTPGSVSRTLKQRSNTAGFLKDTKQLLATTAAPAKRSAQLALAPTGTQQISLPKTSTASNLMILLGIAMLLIAGSLLACLQWRRIKPSSS